MQPIVPFGIGSTAWMILLALPLGATAQEEPESSEVGPAARECTAAEHREFDFWIGSWEVHDGDGELVGHNEIRRVARGCALLESWRGVSGSRGTSINTYDADLGRWTQRWVGAGATLWLEGGLEDGDMVLAGTRPRSTPRGAVLDRITWTPLNDGRVRQLWEVSPDDGRSWNPIFEGFYSRISSDRTAADDEITIVRPSELDWRPTPTGTELATIQGRPSDSGPFTFLVRLPADWTVTPHRHNVAEHITVLSGTLFMRFAPDGRTEELSTGSMVVVPAERPMWAWTGAEETVIQVHGIGPFETRTVEP